MATKKPIGLTIVDVRPMTAKEMEEEDWMGNAPTALVLSDGSILYPSQDPEGNGPGCLFCKTPKGLHILFIP